MEMKNLFFLVCNINCLMNYPEIIHIISLRKLKYLDEGTKVVQ